MLCEINFKEIELTVPMCPWLRWGLDFKKVKEEFTFSKLWKSKTWKDIGIGIALGFLSLIPGSSDLSTDYLSAYNYINGDDYIKKVENTNDSTVSSPNCTLIGESFNVYYGKESNTSERYFSFSCFEQDPFWGGLTLCFTYTPGFIMFGPVFVICMRLLKNNNPDLGKSEVENTFHLLLLLQVPDLVQ